MLHCAKTRQKGTETAFFAASRPVLILLIAIALLFGQVIPGMSDARSSVWIEICTDGGTYLAQIDEDGEQPRGDCTHCTACVIETNTDKTVLPHGGGAQSAALINTTPFVPTPVALPAGAEQFWSSCRGPPIASTENNMTSLSSLSSKEMPETALFTPWGFPWV